MGAVYFLVLLASGALGEQVSADYCGGSQFVYMMDEGYSERRNEYIVVAECNNGDRAEFFFGLGDEPF